MRSSAGGREVGEGNGALARRRLDLEKALDRAGALRRHPDLDHAAVLARVALREKLHLDIGVQRPDGADLAPRGVLDLAALREIGVDPDFPKRGKVENPAWREVRAVRSLNPDVEVKFLSKRDAGEDGSMIEVGMTAKRSGPIEGLLEIETATGKGTVPFTYFATAG